LALPIIFVVVFFEFSFNGPFCDQHNREILGAGFTGCPIASAILLKALSLDGGGLPASGGAKGDQGFGWG